MDRSGILFAGLAFGALCALPARAETWTVVGHHPLAGDIELDTESLVRTAEGQASYHTRLIVLRDIVQEQRVDCRQNFAAGTVVIQSRRLRASGAAPEWKSTDTDPGSLAGQAARYACGK